MSRWTSPAACACSRPAQTWTPRSTTRARVESLLQVELVREGTAVDVLHDDVRRAVVLARVVDLDDVGVGEPGGEARLTDEAVAEDRVVGEVAGEHLDRHRPLELVVPREVDDGHAAAAEDVCDAVAPACKRLRAQSLSSVVVPTVSVVIVTPSSCLS